MDPDDIIEKAEHEYRELKKIIVSLQRIQAIRRGAKKPNDKAEHSTPARRQRAASKT
jgi:hypothetical protein